MSEEENKPRWSIRFWICFMGALTLIQVNARVWGILSWPMVACYWPMAVVVLMGLVAYLLLKIRPPKE